MSIGDTTVKATTTTGQVRGCPDGRIKNAINSQELHTQVWVTTVACGKSTAIEI